MSQKQLEASADLRKLQEEGYELELRGTYVLMHHVPYVAKEKTIQYGTLVAPLVRTADGRPETHVIHFAGEFPCDREGNPILALRLSSCRKNLGEDIWVDHDFSNKPAGGYADFYEKFTQYVKVISSPAYALDNSVTAQTYVRVEGKEEEGVFAYQDTNSGRAQITAISEKLGKQTIGIIGLGGTGAYVLDMVAKCPVKEIHLYDGDAFLQHNAFRTPGAATLEEVKEHEYKVYYLASKYGSMHKHILPHAEYITEENRSMLEELDFVFLCVDNSLAKRDICEFLLNQGIAFVDCGMGITNTTESLLGQVRTTLVTPENRQGMQMIDMSEVVPQEEVYATNIQIAELNCLNACQAVIQWKKYVGFYQNLRPHHTDIFSINDGELFHESA